MTKSLAKCDKGLTRLGEYTDRENNTTKGAIFQSIYSPLLRLG